MVIEKTRLEGDEIVTVLLNRSPANLKQTYWFTPHF